MADTVLSNFTPGVEAKAIDTSRILKIGIIGTGWIAESHIESYLQMPDVQIVAAADWVDGKAEKFMERYGVKGVHFYHDHKELIDNEPDLDAVSVCTFNTQHAAPTIYALEHGVNVLLEKPFTTRLEHARELVDLARERDLLLIDAVPTAFLPNLTVLREQLPRIGRIRLVMSNYSQYSSRYDQLLAGQVPNIFNPEYAGGSLMDINFYNVYLNAALFGKPRSAVYYPNIYPGLADTSGCLILQYPDFVSQCMGAKDTWGVNFFQIEGEKGYIYVSGGANGIAGVQVVTKTENETFNLQENPNRWFYEVQGITRQVLSGDREGFRAGLDTMLTVIEVLENSRKAAGIRFPGD